ncbi:MAG: hypothetical protein IPP46_05100 [Bacteroidetes bacterium]|nr:hypothetical protein [Bacteroidota bacterium]
MNTKVYSGEKVNLIPLPNSIAYKKGHFKIAPETKLLASSSSSRQFALLLNDWMKTTLGYTLPIVETVGRKDHYIAISFLAEDTTEKYRIAVRKTESCWKEVLPDLCAAVLPSCNCSFMPGKPKIKFLVW